MSLDKQIQVYSLDTSSFYNEKEMVYYTKILQLYNLRNKVEDKKNWIKKSLNLKKPKDNASKELIDRYNDRMEDFFKFRDSDSTAYCEIKRCNSIIKLYNKMVEKEKERLVEEMHKTREFNLKHNIIRTARESEFKPSNIVSIFESELLRTANVEMNTLSEDLIIIQTFFFEIIEDLILDGFKYKGEKYRVFTASAGQIRLKKVVFIKESTYNKVINTVTCGLSIDEINSKGGMNVNKFLAYLALCNSATDRWSDFDIDKAIVVDDMETLVPADVDFIDDKTYSIERRHMNVPVPHMDGCGMISDTKSKKNFMFRMPWFKGLLAVFPFKKFIREMKAKGYKNCGIVKDVWGNEYDILKEGIEYIFTKSQFKMWKFYDSWDDYKTRFKKYNCHASKCNEEDDKIPNATINYQMLQSLFIMTEKEIEELTKKSRLEIDNIGRNPNSMLKALCAVGEHEHLNPFQEAVKYYNPLLRDNHTRETIKDIKRSRIKDGRSGKLRIDGKYTFLIPDLYAFCEWLFLGEENPKGLLNNGEVSCRLYNERKLDCLRSPHLYVEHAVRKNKHTQDTKKWFLTKGIYTSIHDVISKILQFDNDGDKALVVAEDIIINVAEEEIKEYDIVPLFYNMRKAEPQILTNEVLFNGMKSAWVGGNIGIYSNNISKIYNSEQMVCGTKEQRLECLNVIKLLCMENNFVIDYAKTLYKPERPKWARDLITKFTKEKLPNFFIYAKDKGKDQVADINDSVVNKFEKYIPNTPIKFDFKNGDKTVSSFYYKHLLHDKKFEFDEHSQEVIDCYFSLHDNIRKFGKVEIDEKRNPYNSYVFKNMKKELLSLGYDEDYIIDTLVTSLYKDKIEDNNTLEEKNIYNKNTSRKDALWYMFGETILKNIKSNVKPSEQITVKHCERCGKIIGKEGNNTKYCSKCKIEIRKEQKRLYAKKMRECKK